MTFPPPGRTAESLRAAGWHPAYAIDPEPVAEALIADGLAVSDAWRAFVARFGGLRLTFPHHCVAGETDTAHFDAVRAADGVFPAWLVEWQQRAGEPLAPVGEAFRDYMIVLIGGSGAVYAAVDHLLLRLGGSAEEAIVGLCEGRDPTPVT
jgi:hypothetical protein